MLSRRTLLSSYGVAISLACVGLAVLILSLTADATARKLLTNTLILCGGVAGISVPLGTALGVFLGRTNVACGNAARFLLITLLFLPLHATAAAWVAVFGKLGGPPAFFETSEPLMDGMPAVIWIHAMAAVPWVAIVVSLGASSAPRESEEAALLDASPLWVFWKIGLPYLLPFIAAAGLLVMVGGAGEMTVTNLYMVPTYAEEMYNNVVLLKTQVEIAAAALPGISATALLVVAACVLISLTLRPAVVRQGGAPRIHELGTWRWGVSSPLWLVLIIVAGVPISSLIYKAGLSTTLSAGSVVRTWSPQTLAVLLVQTPAKYQVEIGYSLVIATLSATLAFLAALPLALLGRRGGAATWPAILIAAICWALPAPAVGLGMLYLFNVNFAPLLFLRDTPLPPALAIVFKSLPATILILWSALSSLPRQTLEAARIDGAGPFATFWRIVLPLRGSAMAAAWLVAFAIGLGDLAWSILVIPPGPETLQRVIFGWIHSGVDDRIAAATLVTLLTYGLLAIAIGRLLRRGEVAAERGKPT